MPGLLFQSVPKSVTIYIMYTCAGEKQQMHFGREVGLGPVNRGPDHEKFSCSWLGKANSKRHFITYVVFREFRWFWGARQIVNGSIQNILQNLCELIKNVLSTYLRATRLLFTILILTEHGDAICQDLGAHQVGVVKCLCLLNVGPHARREAYL